MGPTWRIRSENKRRKWDTGRFPGSPRPSVLQINNPGQPGPAHPRRAAPRGAPPPRSARPRLPRGTLSASRSFPDRPPEAIKEKEKKATPGGGWGSGRASERRGRLETAPALRLVRAGKGGVAEPYYAVRGPNNIPAAVATPRTRPFSPGPRPLPLLPPRMPPPKPAHVSRRTFGCCWSVFCFVLFFK